MLKVGPKETGGHRETLERSLEGNKGVCVRVLAAASVTGQAPVIMAVELRSLMWPLFQNGWTKEPEEESRREQSQVGTAAWNQADGGGCCRQSELGDCGNLHEAR